MSTEWTPPTYMHKARTSDTSFLNEKKRITGKMLQKQLKPIQKHKTKQNLINSPKSPKSPRSPRSPRFPKSPKSPKSPRSPKTAKSPKSTKSKNKTKKQNVKTNLSSPVSNQPEPQTETVLQSLVHEYESSDSEIDHKQHPEQQLVLQSIVEEQVNTDAVIEDEPNTITINETTPEQLSLQLSAETETPIIVTEFVFDDSTPNDVTEQQSHQDTEELSGDQNKAIVTEKIVTSDSKQEKEHLSVNSGITDEIKEEETIISVDLIETKNENEIDLLEQKSNQLSSPTSLLSIVSSETEPIIDIEHNVMDTVTVEVDETSFLSMLKTLDYQWLDKDGNGTISRNYFRYYFKSKIKKQINDKHVLNVFQNINKNGTSYVTIEQVKHWTSKMTSFRLEQILKNKLLHKQYSSRGSDIPDYIDQTSLLTFLKTINIKTLNNEAGFIKIFDFGLYFNRNYKRQITDIDMFEKIFYDINHNHNGRITNDEYNNG